MVQIRILAIVALFFLSFNNISFAQYLIYRGTTAGIVKADMTRNLQGALMALGDLKKAKLEIETSLGQLRKDYWSKSLSSSTSETLTNQYLKLLTGKDMYFLMVEMMNVMRNNENGKSSLKGLGDALEYVSGGELDGGIHPLAKNEFNNWANQMAAKYLQVFMLGGTTQENIMRSAEELSDDYLKYVYKRDLAEYLFKNPYSPLRSVKGEEYIAGFYMAIEQTTTLDQGLKTVAEMKSVAGETAFHNMVQKIKSFYTLETLEKKLSTRNASKLIDWYLTQKDAKLYALYLIKRRTGGDWNYAKNILNDRYKRHGKTKIDSLIQTIWQNSQNQNSDCVGDPSLQRKKTGELNDCLADQLGNSELWHNTLALTLLNLDRDKAKKFVLDQIRQFSPQEDATKFYAFLISNIDETLLLAAIHNQLGKGKSQVEADGSSQSLGNVPDMWLAIRVLEGFSYAANSHRTFGIMMLNQENATNFYEGVVFERLKKGISAYKDLEKTYSAPKLLEAVKNNWPEELEVFYPKSGIGWHATQMRRSLRNNTSSGSGNPSTIDQLRSKYREQLQNAGIKMGADDLVFASDEVEILLKKCNNKDNYTQATVHLIFKKGPDYLITDNDEFAIRMEELIFPLIKKHCSPFISLAFFNYVKGFHIHNETEVFDDKEWTKFQEESAYFQRTRESIVSLTYAKGVLLEQSKKAPEGSRKVQLEQQLKANEQALADAHQRLNKEYYLSNGYYTDNGKGKFELSFKPQNECIKALLNKN